MMSVVRMRPSVICVNPWGTACCSVSVICWKRVDGHRLSGNLFDGIEPDCKPAAKADRHHRLLRARQRAKVLVAKAAGPMAADPAGSQTQRSPEARSRDLSGLTVGSRTGPRVWWWVAQRLKCFPCPRLPGSTPPSIECMTASRGRRSPPTGAATGRICALSQWPSCSRPPPPLRAC